ncbi:MAG: DUF805 domain-containing protein [Hyphomicrobiales bacterium]
MRLTALLFSLDGRIGRAQFWLGTAILLGISLAATYGILSIIGLSEAAVAFSAAVAFALAYPSYAVCAKRFQDRGKPGPLALLGIVPSYGANLLYTFGIFDLDHPSLQRGLDVIIVVIGLWFLVELGFLKGTQGPNRYGPDPLGRQQADAALT